MKTAITLVRSLCLWGLLMCLTLSVQAQQPAIQMLSEYFDLVASGNSESATYMWTEPAQNRSARFGIVYTDLPVRVDCTSPAVRFTDALRGRFAGVVKQSENLAGDTLIRLQFQAIIGSKNAEWFYYAQKIGNYYWFTYPQDYFGRAWPITESRYFRVHVHPACQALLNPAVLEEGDRFVERISDSLKLGKERMTEIARDKIEYFFCDDEATVRAITNQTTRGLLDLASNDIISSDFPHFHEIVHLLVNMKLREVPLMTLPILREGLAVRYGGRWGKRPSALMDLGVYLLREKIVELDSVLTAPEFEAASGSDIAYPVAGVFVTYLVHRLGEPAFYELYRSLSYSDGTLDTLNHLEIRKKLVTALHAEDWSAVANGFSAYCDTIVTAAAVAQPGTISGGKELFKSSRVLVKSNKDWLAFEFSSDSSSGNTEGNLLFGPDPRLKGARSHLFDEQYRDSIPFEGYRYGVRVDRNEAGLYDYATNELVAKYIWGISPSDEYFSETDKKVRIRFRTSLVGKILPSAGSCSLLPH